MRRCAYLNSSKNEEEKTLYRRIISYALVYSTLAVICCVILWDAGWVFDIFFGDDYQLVNTTAIGKNAHSWTGNGRFWPLGLCDYCLLLLIPRGTTVTAHFLYNCVTMILSSAMFFSFLKKITGDKGYAAVYSMLILFLTSSFVLIHMSCIFPEREMFLMLAAFLASYWNAVNNSKNPSKQRRYYAVALITAAYATYLKEPAFIIWSVFAVLNFGARKERAFSCALLLNSIIWVSIYAYRCFFIDRAFINSERQSYASVVSNLSDVSLQHFNNEPFMYVLLGIAVVKAYLLITRKREYDAFADSTLFAGIGYSFAYVLLSKGCNHYFFPAIVLGIPAFTKFFMNSTKYLKIILAGASIFTSVFSMNASVRWISEIMKHRRADPLIFYRMIDEAKQGKRIIYITEKGKDTPNIDSRETDQMKFRRCQIFLNYYWGGEFPIVKTADYSKINKDAIIICSDETRASIYFKEISEHLEKNGLKLSLYLKGIGIAIFRTKHTKKGYNYSTQFSLVKNNLKKFISKMRINYLLCHIFPPIGRFHRKFQYRLTDLNLLHAQFSRQYIPYYCQAMIL